MKKMLKSITLLAATGLMASAAYATPVSRADVVGDTSSSIGDTVGTATVETSGCSSATVCTLDDLMNGGSMTVNGITISGASVDFTHGAYENISFSAIEFYGLDSVIDPYTGGFGMRGNSDYPFDLYGFDAGDMDISFQVTTIMGLELTGMGAVNQVFAGQDFSSALSFEGDNGMALDFYNSDTDADGILATAFDATSSFMMTSAISNFADNGGYNFYDGYQIAFTTQIPEPAPLLLMAGGLLWLVRRKTA